MTDAPGSQILRRGSDRGFVDHGWLRSYHSFSFASYYDPRHVQFGALRVVNEDRIAAGAGFGTHSHRDMEIISYVLEGELAHQDSMGNGSVIRPGDVQRMSAGRGVEHSDFNQSKEIPAHFLQIWIIPDPNDIEPGYEQLHFTSVEKQDQLRLIASSNGCDHSVLIHQDARLYASVLTGDAKIEYAVRRGRRAYTHVVRGSLSINPERLDAGDALLVRRDVDLTMGSAKDAEVLLFDLAL